ncbi:MAG: 23S rRNA (uracil(1939)-C(5))-methyltransferase RlmD [Thermodesulfobacteriota bacterium]
MRVRIESVAYKGYGVGRFQGKVLFVPYTVTGDDVLVSLIEERKNYSIAKLEKVFFYSPWRRTPPCPYFGRCGGCQWQHIDPSIQGELKREILKELLKRVGGLKEIPSLSIIPSPFPYGYRVRIQLKLNGKRMGFFEERSNRLIEIEECLIAHPLINTILKEVKKGSFPLSELRKIEINVSPDEEKGILILHPNPSKSIKYLPIQELLRSSSILKGIVLVSKRERKSFGDPILHLIMKVFSRGIEKVFHLRASPESFYQVNLTQNLKLIETVLEFAQLGGEERVLDLYSGIGNLTLPLATESKQVIGIEGNRKAIEDSLFNAKKNQIENCHFLQGKVEERIKEVHGGVDLIVLDPPRRGARAILDEIDRLHPKRILYISCEPPTFVRDIRILSQKGYSLREVRLVDMFPQSYHMEVVGLLQD